MWRGAASAIIMRPDVAGCLQNSYNRLGVQSCQGPREEVRYGQLVVRGILRITDRKLSMAEFATDQNEVRAWMSLRLEV